MLRNRSPETTIRKSNILNEVLSLNAQEFEDCGGVTRYAELLNEVLSLNAQEFNPVAYDQFFSTSSMKS